MIVCGRMLACCLEERIQRISLRRGISRIAHDKITAPDKFGEVFGKNHVAYVGFAIGDLNYVERLRGTRHGLARKLGVVVRDFHPVSLSLIKAGEQEASLVLAVNDLDSAGYAIILVCINIP